MAEIWFSPIFLPGRNIFEKKLIFARFSAFYGQRSVFTFTLFFRRSTLGDILQCQVAKYGDDSGNLRVWVASDWDFKTFVFRN